MAGKNNAFGSYTFAGNPFRQWSFHGSPSAGGLGSDETPRQIEGEPRPTDTDDEDALVAFVLAVAGCKTYRPDRRE